MDTNETTATFDEWHEENGDDIRDLRAAIDAGLIGFDELEIVA